MALSPAVWRDRRISAQPPRSLAGIFANCPELAAAEQLIRSFAEILTSRSGQHRKDRVIAAQIRLRLARPLAADLRRPWGKPAGPGRLPRERCPDTGG
ncbi:hypothetical protein [Streptomyces sp. NPDC045369]|uniref:hypothetical protein n=1 Tax=Streptomyces sp. NPDC045369 TaxID=3155732 RepID=UPI0033CEE039